MGYDTMLLVGHYQHSIFQITKIIFTLENIYKIEARKY